jgi:phenylalanine-specific permease
MICLAHLKFRAAMRRKGASRSSKRCWPCQQLHLHRFPADDLVLMCTMDGMRLSAILLPVWILFLFVAFTLRRKA